MGIKMRECPVMLNKENDFRVWRIFSIILAIENVSISAVIFCNNFISTNYVIELVGGIIHTNTVRISFWMFGRYKIYTPQPPSSELKNTEQFYLFLYQLNVGIQLVNEDQVSVKLT